jgi:glycosyltransferase involved in cell wall biosynthesis
METLVSDTNSVKISILLPTRGRTDLLKRSLLSLINKVSNVNSIEILLAFDNDDIKSYEFFQENIAPDLDQHDCAYTAMGFERLGYIRLNEYLNALARHARGSWLFFWGDDAVMQSPDWDLRITEVNKFRILRIPTHNQHPYAILPIIPRAWFELFGYISAHQLTDSWVSQIAYMVDIIHNVDIDVLHDRFDLTGNNKDETWNNRPMLEGRPEDPRDFNHPTWRRHRIKDANAIAEHLQQQGEDITWWNKVKTGQQDPWEKMLSPEYDPNRQISKF